MSELGQAAVTPNAIEFANAMARIIETAYKDGYRNGAENYIGEDNNSSHMARAQQVSWDAYKGEVERLIRTA